MNIFYSWQSDLEKKGNQSFVEKALYMAVVNVETDEERNLINADRYTEGVSGTVNIKDTIPSKILQSQILVYDISIISNNDKKYINSNVAFELGFGVCALGWEKIILIFDNSCGDIGDIPFNVRGHRVIQYKFNGDLSSKAASMKELTSDLKSAIEAIINGKNFKMQTGTKLNNKKMRMKNDYEKLYTFLKNIHIPTFNNNFKLVNEANLLIPDILHYYEGIKTFVCSMEFYFYDEDLKTNILEFYKYFSSMLNYDDYFISNNDKFFQLNTNNKKIESDFRRDAELAMVKMKNLLEYIKTTYPNIDFKETNQKALLDKRRYEKIYEHD